MHREGSVRIKTRRHGLLAGLRQKQWWYFEGLDPEHSLYAVFLALQAFPRDYVSVKVIDYGNHRRWESTHLGVFHAGAGDRVDVKAEGRWGHMVFGGRADQGWSIELETSDVAASLEQSPQGAYHHNRLLTRYIDYTVSQFVMNDTSGTLTLNGREQAFSGYGYHEHNWGVQPRHSTANWLHFWAEDMAGVVLDCRYDAGIPHHYTFVWRDGRKHRLSSPAEFYFDADRPNRPWRIQSPDLELELTPLYAHHTQMKLPPVLPYIDVDYLEVLSEVGGTAIIGGVPVPIRGIGKYDHNFNKW
jgi:hypothetical protein